MISFSPFDPAVLSAYEHGAVKLSVVCYCAGWCRSCGQYQSVFSQVAQEYPDAMFLWVDIEEYETLLDDYDVHDFPTILIQNEGRNVFFGSTQPKAEVLNRLVRVCRQDATHAVPGPASLSRLLPEGAAAWKTVFN